MSRRELETNAGKVTLTTILSLLLVAAVAFFLDLERGGPVEPVRAQEDTATTTVTVLNTPPAWSVDAQEEFESSTANPTNVGSTTQWIGTATDANGEDYFLLICKSSSTPSATEGAQPQCGGGASDQWAISATTTSGAQARAIYTVQAGDPESNDWYAYVCDANSGNAECNLSHRQGSGNTASPWIANHLPTFTVFSDDSPTDPGDVVTWTTTASDPDSLGGADTVQLYVCTTANFTPTTGCDDGTRATSTFTTSNPSASTTITIPTQDTDYEAYGFIVDEHELAASGGQQGVDSVLTVANVAPVVSTTTIALLDVGGLAEALTLTQEEGETTGFEVQFDVDDDNSCEAAGGGDEIASTTVSVYRSSVGRASCDAAGEYDANNCYPSQAGASTWNISCSQDAGSCSGSSDPTASWTCTFPLWYIADPTDAGTPFAADNWLAAIRGHDDDAATGPYSVDDDGEELESFTQFAATGSPIAYGSLEPGENTTILFATTTLRATGNTGLDQNLDGNDMCPTYPNCTGNATSTIFVNNQEYATSTVSFGSGTDLSGTATEVELNVQKTTATSSPSTGNTFWGIAVPGAITFAGDYVGLNNITGLRAEAADW